MRHCMRPKMLSPIVSPTKCCNVHDTQMYQVPHIHPSHTTFHHHKIFQHLHSFPHTVSNVSDVAHQHFNCSPGMAPGFGAGMGMGMAPGFGAGMGPGMGPGFGTGMGPGMGFGGGPGMMAPQGFGSNPFGRP